MIAFTRIVALAAAAAMAEVPAEEPLPETVAPGAALVEIYAADRFFEGPTWDPATGKLYFTSFGAESPQILRWDGPGQATVWLDNTEGVNGTFLARDGRMLAAQAFGHRVLSFAIGPDGPTDTQVLYFNPELHQPNDVCQAPNGNIYFSDPDFDGRATGRVYVLTPDGQATAIITDTPVPNGLEVSIDGQTLYVGDDHLDHWRAYPIGEDGTTGEGRVFFNPQGPNRTQSDGMCLDEHGNLYFSGQCRFEDGKGGVWVVSPEGVSLGRIATPEFCSNVCFGGPDGTTLYLTCANKVYSLQMAVHGPKR
jgi:gluconolactonase